MVPATPPVRVPRSIDGAIDGAIDGSIEGLKEAGIGHPYRRAVKAGIAPTYIHTYLQVIYKEQVDQWLLN